jgi:hypothetical protein
MMFKTAKIVVPIFILLFFFAVGLRFAQQLRTQITGPSPSPSLTPLPQAVPLELPDHLSSISGGWQAEGHEEVTSHALWPPFHLAPITNSWPLGHSQDDSYTWPANHHADTSFAWPYPHTDDTSSFWPADHTAATSTSWPAPAAVPAP